MSLTKEELQERTCQWGVVLPEDESISWTNEALTKACADKYLQEHPELDTWGQRYVWSLSNVMLCKHMKDEIKNFDIPPIESDDYVAEFKENGMRVVVCYDPLKYGFEMFTRKESDITCLNGNITDKTLFIRNGFVSQPKDWVGKFPYRFVLDGEILADGETVLDGVEYGMNAVEDFIQSIFSAGTEKAIEIQKAGHNMSFHIFDVLYFQKDNLEVYPEMTYSYKEEEVTPAGEKWVEEHFRDYLESAQFIKPCGKKKAKPKKLYAYLLSLRKQPKYSVMHFPFLKRRKLRHQLVELLAKNNLPFVEVDGRDDAKVTYLDEVLSAGGEGCFKGTCMVKMADGTEKRIKDVKVGEYVLSYNIKEKKLEPKRVLNVFNNGLKHNSEWCSVSHGILQGTDVADKQNMYHRVICTKNHKYFDGDHYSAIQELNYCYELNYILDEYREQAILGWLLSDACIGKDNIIRFNQKYDSDFWRFTQEMFKPFTKNASKWQYSGKGSKIGKMNLIKGYTIRSFQRPEGYNFTNFIKRMGPIALAYMIMGDGAGGPKGIRLCTYSYTEEEVRAIAEQVAKLTGASRTPALRRDKRVKSGSGLDIRYTVADTQKIWDVVKEYIHPSMRYKFPKYEQELVNFIEPPKPMQNIVKVPICKNELSSYKCFVTGAYTYIRAWDLEVEDNHNYFVENVLVHNCILKNIHAPYIAGLRSSRSHRACMKVKQSISQIMDGQKMYEDFDVFITGANPPKSPRIKDMIGSLSCSIYMIDDRGEQVIHEIANVSGLSHEWKRKLAQVDDTGKISLNPEYLNKVIAVDGMALSGTSLKFHHAVLKNKETLEFKAKNPTDCCWDIDTLRDMVLTRGK